MQSLAKRVIIIAYAGKQNFSNTIISGIDIINVEINTKLKVSLRILQFFSEIKKIAQNLIANFFVAMDFYSLYPAEWLKFKFGGILIYDSREIYSALGTLSKKSIKQKILESEEKRLVKSVDMIIVSGELDADYLAHHFQNCPPIIIIKNYPPKKPRTNLQLIRKRFALPEESIILIYQGMLLEGRGLFKSISCLKYIPNTYLCLMGDGNLNDDLKTHSAKEMLDDRVIFGGLVPYSELHDWTCSADIGLSLIEPISLSYKFALPNKLFEYSMAGIPSISTDLPAIKPIYDEFNIGKLLPIEHSPEMIANAVMDILADYSKFADECEKASVEYNYESQIDSITKLLS